MNKVAVIGLGNIAIRHRKNLKLLFPDSALYAMSASGRKVEEKVSDADIIVSSIDELIESNVNLVIVASPAPFHAKHSVALIEAGIPTLIEKPVATTLEDISAIEAAIEKHGTPVSVGYCLRYLSSAQRLKSLLDDGIIGDLYNVSIEIGQYLPDWRPSKHYKDYVSSSIKLGGGALFELSHEIDYAQWLLGPLTPCYAILRSSNELGLDVEDMVDLLAVTEARTVVSIHLDFLQRTAYRRCSLVGSKGRLDWDLLKNQLDFTSPLGNETLYSDSNFDKNQMYLDMLKDFIELINQKPNNAIQVSEAKITVELIKEVKSKYEIARD